MRATSAQDGQPSDLHWPRHTMLFVWPGPDIICHGQGNSGPGCSSLMSLNSPCDGSVRVWYMCVGAWCYGGGSYMAWDGFGQNDRTPLYHVHGNFDRHWLQRWHSAAPHSASPAGHGVRVLSCKMMIPVPICYMLLTTSCSSSSKSPGWIGQYVHLISVP